MKLHYFQGSTSIATDVSLWLTPLGDHFSQYNQIDIFQLETLKAVLRFPSRFALWIELDVVEVLLFDIPIMGQWAFSGPPIILDKRARHRGNSKT